MKVRQLWELVNTATQEVLGETAVVQEDLSNLVDIGKEIINADSVDNYVRKLINHIGKVVFVNRQYAGGAPSVLMDSWEFGSVLQKVSAEMPEAQENDAWNLQDGQDYSPNVFYQPKVEAKFFNSKVTFEIPVSFTEMQVKESFSNAEQLNGFLSMLVNAVDNAMTVKVDSLIMRTINNMIGETFSHDLGDEISEETIGELSGIRAVNLLKLYNDQVEGEKLTFEQAISDRDFIRFATYTIGLYTDRMAKISKLFNAGGKARFTPKDLQHIVLLSDFAKASETFLLSDTFNSDRVALPNHETVPYWQGSGEMYSFDDVSSINVKVTSGSTLNVKGILGIIFDRDALGVANLDRRVTSNYNAKGEFYTNFYKFDAGFYNDLNENFVVFFIG